MNTKPLVLIAENEEDSLWRFSRWIGEIGCQVVVASGGNGLLARLAPEKPDLLVLDIGEGDEGLALCRQLKSPGGVGGLPLIAVAAELDFGMRERARRAGADAVLVKPVSRIEMISQVRRLLGMVDDDRLEEKIKRLEQKVWMRASRATGS